MKENDKHIICELIKDNIDLLIFEENEQLSVEMSNHIKSCNGCQSYFTESLRAKKIIGQMQKEPELRDPNDLTKSILNQIDEVGQIPKSNNGNPKIYWLVRRTLAAASICLMIVFGIEQYILFDKISKMEEYVSHISIEYKNANLNIELKNGNLYNLLHYNLGFQPESINKFFTKNLNSPDHLNLKARLIRTRLSAMAINNLDNQRINQIMQEVSARIIKNKK